MARIGHFYSGLTVTTKKVDRHAKQTHNIVMKDILKSVYMAVPFKRQLFSLVKLFYDPPHSVYKHLYFKGKFKVKVEDSFFYINHHGYQIENDIFWKGLKGAREGTSLSLWTRLCKKSNVILDIGSNTGVYSLTAKAANPKAMVYGFDPVDRVFDKFKNNCKLNNFDIRLFKVAISNHDGRAAIYDVMTEHTYGVTVNTNRQKPETPVVKRDIETKKLSTFIEEEKIRKIDLMKVDVETHEPEVLLGMERYLDMMKPTMIMEILTDEVGRRVQEILQGKGYLYFNIDESKPPEQVAGISKSDSFNYLICLEPVAKELALI